MNIDEALPTFIAESADLLVEMENGLLLCTGNAPDSETINQIFRSAHTIKGSAGLFGLDHIVRFVHVVESVLDEVRQGHLPFSEELTTLLLRGKDHTQTLLSVSAVTDPALQLEGDTLIEALRGCMAGSSAARKPAQPARAEDDKLKTDAAATAERIWDITVRFGADVFRAGMDPLGFVRYLTTLGRVLEVRVQCDGLPALRELDPETCHLGFVIELQTNADQARIESAFDFVREDCVLSVVPRELQTGADAEAEQPGREATHTSSASAQPSTVENPATAASAAASSAAQQSGASSNQQSPQQGGMQLVRVEAQKIDGLISRVGELIVGAAAAQLLASRSGSAELMECTSSLSELIEQVREASLQLRMVKIGPTFQRFTRAVRAFSQELGKKIELEIHGEDTELDKTVVEQIGDPLMHLVRNAIDHGIESAERRAAKGKPKTGTVTLNAFHDSGSIVIQVRDDGGGLRREVILKKAIERGLTDESRILTDREVFDFIFEPGFSTAAKVTNISGRGVGMDVVRRNIKALRGSIAIDSVPDVGTTITVRLPLTLAIIHGFQIGIGRSIFVLPLESVDECIEFTDTPGREFVNLRGQVLPFVRLREIFATREPPGRRQSIIVVKYGNQRAGLVVDTLLGEFQTVIKPLNGLLANADYASGSSILGSGEVALILDVPLLLSRAIAKSARHAESDPFYSEEEVVTRSVANV